MKIWVIDSDALGGRCGVQFLIGRKECERGQPKRPSPIAEVSRCSKLYCIISTQRMRFRQ